MLQTAGIERLKRNGKYRQSSNPLSQTPSSDCKNLYKYASTPNSWRLARWKIKIKLQHPTASMEMHPTQEASYDEIFELESTAFAVSPGGRRIHVGKLGAILRRLFIPFLPHPLS